MATEERKIGNATYITVDTEEYSYMVLKEEVAPLAGEDGEPLPTPEELAEAAMAKKPERYHGVRTAGMYIGMSARSVRDRCERGEIKATKPNGIKWIIPETELDRYLDKVAEGKPTTIAAKRKLALINPEVDPMTDETTGLVTTQQAADYMGFGVEYVRKLYADGVITGVKVASSWTMLEADSVKEYAKDIVDGVYLPLGYLYLIDLPAEEAEDALRLIVEQAKELVRIEVRLREDGISALTDAGIVPYRKVPEANRRTRKNESPLELPEQYAELLKKVRAPEEQ